MTRSSNGKSPDLAVVPAPARVKVGELAASEMIQLRERTNLRQHYLTRQREIQQEFELISSTLAVIESEARSYGATLLLQRHLDAAASTFEIDDETGTIWQMVVESSESESS